MFSYTVGFNVGVERDFYGQVTGDYGGHADEEKDALCQVKGADVSMMLLERELTQFPD